MNTLSDLIQQCVDEIKTDPNKKIWSDDLWTYYINQAIRQIEKDGGYDWDVNDGYNELSLIGGIQEYDLPSDFVKLENVYIDTSVLSQTNKNYVLSLGTATSRPNQYYIRGSKIGFYSVPDSSYTAKMLYKRKTTSLSSANPNLEFDDDFGVAIVKYSAYLAWSSPRSGYNDAQTKLNDYKMALEALFASKINTSNANLTFSQGVGAGSYNDKVVF